MTKILKICLLSIILFACKSQRNINETKNNNMLSVSIQNEYNHGEMIKIAVTNISKSSLFIINPEIITIERRTSDNWEQVKILTAPCESPQNAPLESIELPPAKTHYFKWDQKERWCEQQQQTKSNSMSTSKTMEVQVSKGEYRMIITYQIEKSAIFDKIYQEFSII